MASRSSRKPAPHVQPAAPVNVFFLEMPDWQFEFCGMLAQPDRPINPAHIRLIIQGRDLTIKTSPGSAAKGFSGVVISGNKRESIIAAKFPYRRALPENADVKNGVAVWCDDTLIIRFPYKDAEPPASYPPMVNRHDAPVIPIPIDFGPAAAPIIPLPKAPPHERKMQRETTVTVEGNRYTATTTMEAERFVARGVSYLPFSLAAIAAQTTEKSLREWIKKDVRFEGRPIRTYRLSPTATGKLYVSEESIQRLSNRFVKWPSKEPAGAVTIGETPDQSGFLPISEAARILGISGRTMWLWATQGKVPRDKPLDVIKCTTSEYFYILEKDVHDLKSVVPRSGLQRGRRPQAALEP